MFILVTIFGLENRN